MRLHRFYIEQPLGEEFVVEKSELIHQWTRVFRYTSGDSVILFSPHHPGIDYTYNITSISKKEVALVRVSEKKNTLPDKKVMLCMALVKKDAFETVLRQATELGVTTIIPVLSARSEKKDLNLERAHAIVIEAAEQSGRGDIPLISSPCTLEEACLETAGTQHIVASLHENAVPLRDSAAKKDTAMSLWIGPEGGWTDEEEEIFREKGFVSISLTGTVLRADTAATTALAMLLV